MTMRKGLILGSLLCAVLLAAPSLSWAGPDRMPTRPSNTRSNDDSGEAASTMPSPADVGGATASMPNVGSSSQEYVLGAGDRVRLTVYGETDLSGEYEVGSNGYISMPLIGDIRATGQPLRDFERAVRAKLAEGYLRDPRVSAQVVNYRPFFILGEVTKPGSYPYVNGMTILNAVALAGGYTYRADKTGVTITHAHDPEKRETAAPQESTVMPGDIIRVPERFF